jgi:NADPH:quinone reductase-like Zn-dependent oxidoreductase
MKTVSRHRYGAPEVLTIEEVPTPEPQDNEVLIRVRATTVTSGDCRVRALKVPYGFALLSRLVFGIVRPRQPVLGTELAGDVEAVGKQVTKSLSVNNIYAVFHVSKGDDRSC